MSASPIDRVAETISFLVKAPRKTEDLCAVMDAHPNQVREYVKALREHGLVYVTKWTRKQHGGPWTATYAWQGIPFSRKDAPTPPKKERRERDAA